MNVVSDVCVMCKCVHDMSYDIAHVHIYTAYVVDSAYCITCRHLVLRKGGYSRGGYSKTGQSSVTNEVPLASSCQSYSTSHMFIHVSNKRLAYNQPGYDHLYRTWGTDAWVYGCVCLCMHAGVY